ncbi:carbohydrate ABC transporter permease [Clostridium sartagoforme]|uniref:Carbohydrate ABC transporter permease n=1 Tax=Clostridium sartagoforme TaxID=84031 RepID=A0A4S2DI71_9CLOT|nr:MULTISPECIES: carbohydrate ABC transporter permease [Clostridium]MBS5938574.1 carbohydrate ABC transporter permease [Clostridium sp.]TGY41847.1 carbohydrate ABC transporter permease [Clostridium sartagoforme]
MKKVNLVLSKTFIVLMAIITLFPFVYMILSSLMTYQEATSIPPTLFPKEFQWNNFSLAMEQAPFVRYFFNTIFVSGISTIGTVITSILASFALVKLEFKYKNILVLGMAALLMVPYEVTVFTNYQTIAQFGLLDTYTALIIPSLASVFYIFYLKEYLTSIPISYYKAAKVDGCSDLEFVKRILIPLAKPALFTMGILSFINGWNSFLWPILVTNSKEMRLLSNGLSSFATESGTNVQLQMAASTIAIVPILILYLIFRKQIIRGVVKSGVKG